MTNLTPFNLLRIGLIGYFVAAILTVWGMPSHAWILARLLIAGLFFGAVFLALSEGKFSRESKVIVYAFIAVMAYAVLITSPNVVRFMGYMGFRSAIANDSIMYGMIAFGVASMSLNLSQLTYLYKLLLCLSLALFALLLPRLDVAWVAAAADRSTALMREDDFILPYHLQSGLSVLFPVLFLLSFALPLSWRWRMVGAASLFPAIVVGFYYMRRANIVDLAVVLTLLFVAGFVLSRVDFQRKARLLGIFAGGAFAALVLSLVVFRGALPDLMNRTFERFEVLFQPEGLEKQGRVYEVVQWWTHAPAHHQIFGAGSASYHISAATGFYTSGLHIGWAALFLKGGLPLMLFALWLVLRNVRASFRHRDKPYFIAGFALPLFIASSMTHSTVIGGLPNGFAFALALFAFPAILQAARRNPLGQVAPHPHGPHARPAPFAGRRPGPGPLVARPRPIPTFRRAVPPPPA
jgi:hypothetical protein